MKPKIRPKWARRSASRPFQSVHGSSPLWLCCRSVKKCTIDLQKIGGLTRRVLFYWPIRAQNCWCFKLKGHFVGFFLPLKVNLLINLSQTWKHLKTLEYSCGLTTQPACKKSDLTANTDFTQAFLLKNIALFTPIFLFLKPLCFLVMSEPESGRIKTVSYVNEPSSENSFVCSYKLIFKSYFILATSVGYKIKLN